MRKGEAVNALINQVPAVSCIQLPTLEMTDASNRLRKSGRRKGDHTESLPADELRSLMSEAKTNPTRTWWGEKTNTAASPNAAHPREWSRERQ